MAEEKVASSGCNIVSELSGLSGVVIDQNPSRNSEFEEAVKWIVALWSEMRLFWFGLLFESEKEQFGLSFERYAEWIRMCYVRSGTIAIDAAEAKGTLEVLRVASLEALSADGLSSTVTSFVSLLNELRSALFVVVVSAVEVFVHIVLASGEVFASSAQLLEFLISSANFNEAAVFVSKSAFLVLAIGGAVKESHRVAFPAG